MRTCYRCGVELVEGVNWLPYNARRPHYVCDACEQVRHDLLTARGIERYDRIALTRGECLDHIANFGYRQPYEPRLRAMFQYDHRYGPKKFSLNIHQFTLRLTETFWSELAKCALVCGNCHALATQRNWHVYNSKRKDHSASISRV